jgi:HK97 family phage major capsid protein
MASATTGLFSSGSGTGGTIVGYMTGAGGSLVAAGTITPTNLVNLLHKLTPPYRKHAVVVVSRRWPRDVRRLPGRDRKPPHPRIRARVGRGR